MNQEIQLIQYLPLTRARATRKFLNKLNSNKVYAILDLEDSAQDPFDLDLTRKLKRDARNGLLSISESFDEEFKSKIYIRINAKNTEFFEEDIEVVSKAFRNGMPIRGIFFPKTEVYNSVQVLDEVFLNQGIELDIVPMIETKNGYKGLEQLLIDDLDDGIFSKVHYGHFDYALDSGLWPFPDPFHKDFWQIVIPMVELLDKYKKVYIHTPFPFPNDHQLFWSSLFYLRDLMPTLKFWGCTLNLELSLSDYPKDISKMDIKTITQSPEQLIAEAELMINDFYQGRANKRSFGMSSRRFIPPHQFFAAKKYLKKSK